MMKSITTLLIALVTFFSFQLPANEVYDDIDVIMRSSFMNKSTLEPIMEIFADQLMDDLDIDIDSDDLLDLIDEEMVAQIFYRVFQKYFTDTEIHEIRQIYESPVFQKFIGKSQAILEDFFMEIQGVFSEVLGQYCDANDSYYYTKEIEKLNSKNFDELIINSDKPAVVFVCAKWCKPCNLLKPIIEELVEELSGDILFAKMDFDKNQKFTKKNLKVKRLPTVLFFKDGQIVGRAEGFMTKKKLMQKLAEVF